MAKPKKAPDSASTAAAAQAASPPPLSFWRIVFTVAMDPGALVRDPLAQRGWVVALSVSGLAFGLFFLQTGLDRARAGLLDASGVATLALAGVVFGTLGIVFTGVLAWAGARLLGGQGPLGRAVRAFALAYSATLVYAALGLAFSLALGWPTAVAFGVTGALWALGPMMAVLKDMVGGRAWPATLLASACGLLVLLGWARLGALV